MKVLSVKQPWAYLIVEGLKSVENRSWSTEHRGTLLIHASKEWDDFERGYSDVQVLQHLCQSSRFPLDYDDLPKIEQHEEADVVEAIDFSAFKTGGIIGQVKLQKIIDPDGMSKREKKRKVKCLGKYWNPNYKGWILTNPKRIPFTPAKGQLRLWNYDEPIDVIRSAGQPALF